MKRVFKNSFVLILVVGYVLGAFSAAFAQGTNLGTIRGTVTDASGAVVAGAPVKIVDLTTSISRDLTTNGEGNYEAAGLKPGNYSVTISAAGFKTVVLQAVLNGSETVRADAKLEVGSQDVTVNVTAEAGIIQKETPTIAGTISAQQFQQVPRDSREVLEFLYLNPDITQGANGDGSFKFIGAQSYGATFSLDGQRTNGGIFGEPTSSQPSLETIGELTVLSKNFTAEYSGIANIRIETRRGGNQYHGSLFYNNKNSALAARALQDKIAEAEFLPTPALDRFPTPYFNLNETGGSFGGPMPFSHKKTFFLFAYERRWDDSPVQLRSSQIPTSLILGGNFSVISPTSRPVVPAAVLPLLTPTELANNTFLTGTTRRFISIPQRLLNPIAVNILSRYYPVTNPATPFSSTTGRLVDFVQNFTGLLTRDLSTLRVDHDFSDKDKFYAVYNFQTRSGIRSLVASPLPAFGLLSQHQANHTLSLSYTRIFSDHFVNELRGGFNIQNLFRRANQTTEQFLSGVGFNADEIAAYGAVVGPDLLITPGQVAFTIGPFAGISAGGRNTNRPLDQHLATFGDTVSWIRGNHSFKFGADVVRNQAVDGFAFNRNNPRGTVNYGTSFNGFANFLLGLPPTSVLYVSKVRPALDVANWENGFFIQDDYRIRPNLTLNLGLRYELITPYVDKNDLLINFDPDHQSPNGNPGRFIVPTASVIPQIDPRFVSYGVVTAKEAGVGRGLLKTDTNNFAPRLGVAWRLSGKSVLRGGYGVFYPTSAAQGARDAFASSAFNQRITKSSTAATPLGGLPGGINPPGITPFNGGTVRVQGISVNAIPVDLQNPRVEQYNVTFEHEVGWNTAVRVSYIGARQHHLIGGVDLNELPPNTTPFGITNDDGDRCDPLEGDCSESAADQARRPFPLLGSFLASYGNQGRGRSNAFQVEVNKRFARGLTFNASYTLLDQKSSGIDVGNSSLGGALYNQFIPSHDLSTDSFVSRHRFVAYGAYELPVGRDREFGKGMSNWADQLVGNWDLTWNMFAKSGTGFTPFWICDNCDPVFPGNIGSGFVDAVGDFSGPSFRPLVLGDPYAGVNGDLAFNPAAFGLPPTGADVFDNPAVAKRNSLKGPGSWGVNLGLHKFFKFSETTRLELGADFDNVFNHPLLSPPGASGDTSTATGAFANLGDFNVSLNAAGQPVILPENVTLNPNFGRKNQSFSQEGIDNRRSVRLRARLTF
ncbi:MAG TPA: carboxypeptidase regulatory-like domain-containing protein [Blastocatellia bacterium]|nr:carboxypeptidase regulatory-like domain-containing protein [Blastocatellia bacterium]